MVNMLWNCSADQIPVMFLVRLYLYSLSRDDILSKNKILAPAF